MKTIKSKILLTYVGVTIIALLLSWFFTSIRISDYLEDVTRERIREGTHQIINYIKSDTSGSYTEMYNKIKILSALNDTRITLMDRHGKVWYDSDVDMSKIDTVENHSNREEVKAALQNRYGSAKRFSHTVQKFMIYYAEYHEPPFKVGSKDSITFIRTSIPIITINRLGSELKFILAVSALLSLIIIFVTSLQISEWITKPLKNLKDFALDLKNGIYKRRYHVSKKDEIGILAETMNQLADNIEREKNEVERLEGIKREFITNMTHELRTPLFVIESSLETLESMEYSDTDRIREFVYKASSQTKRLHKVIDNLILISKLRSGEHQVSMRPFKIADLVKKIYNDHLETTENYNITFNLSQNISEDRKIQGDRQLITYAVNNLLDNAIRFTDEKGNITLSLYEDGGDVCLKVIDSGKGMNAKDLKNITEYFYRPDKDRNSSSGGAGLGLAIVKQIIHLHEGELLIKSEPSKGSEFGFRFKK